MPGKLAVAVHCTDEPESFLWTEDDVGNRGYSDVGTVLASGTDDFKPGDVVLVVPRWGKYIRNFKAGGWVYTLARFFGDCGKDGTQCLYNPSDAILAAVDMNELKIKPKGGRVLVKREPCATEHCGIILPDTVGNRSGKSLVLEVAPDVVDVKAGDTVICHAGSYDRAGIPDELAGAYDCKPADLAFIPASSIYAVVEP